MHLASRSPRPPSSPSSGRRRGGSSTTSSARCKDRLCGHERGGRHSAPSRGPAALVAVARRNSDEGKGALRAAGRAPLRADDLLPGDPGRAAADLRPRRLLDAALYLPGVLMDLFAQIDRWARRAPERPAHISGARALTYGELIRRSDALADDGAPIAVVGNKEPEMLIAFLGAVKSGRPYVPLDTSLPAQRIERIVASSGAALTLTPARVAELSGGADPAPPRGHDPAE